MQRRHMYRWAGASLLALLALAPAGAAAQGSGSSSTPAGGSSVGRYVTASGVSLVRGAGTASAGPRTLDVGVQVHVHGSNIETGAQQAEQKITAVEAALEKAGVDPTAIRMQSFNVNPQYGPSLAYAQDGTTSGSIRTVSPPQPALKQTTGFAVNENLQVTVGSLSQMASAMSAAISAGATNVNTFTPCCAEDGSAPGTGAMSTAIGQATAQAEANARAAAQAAGLTLGMLHLLTVDPPTPQGPFGPNTAPEWRVQVTVKYDVAS